MVRIHVQEVSQTRRKPMKSAGLAAVLSFLLPGLGQIYNGEIFKGLVLVVIDAINGALMFVLIGFITWPITVIYAVYDA